MADGWWGAYATRTGGPVEGGASGIEASVSEDDGQRQVGPQCRAEGISSGERPLPGMSSLTSLLGPQVGPAQRPVSEDASGRGSSSPSG